ncbi:MAG: tetratricopeptide repeat protein [Phycisphaerales bacterium JB061]
MMYAGRAKTLSASAVLGLALISGTIGCSGHGKSTSEGLTLAHERMAQIKSATQWEMANESYMAGDLERALESVNNSLTLNPSVAKSHVLRGKILFEMGRLEEARDSLLRAEIIKPDTIDAVYFLGIVHERLAQKEEALTYYQKAADLDPAEAMYAVATAEILIDLGRPDEAEAYLSERSNVFGHNAGVQQTLGHLAMIQGDDTEAESRFRTAWTLSPEEPAILEDLINAQMSLGRFAEAEHNITQLLQHKEYEDRRDIHRLRSRCLLELDRTMEAREELLKLTEAKEGQTDLSAWLDLGVVSYSINDMPRLRQAAQRIIELAPERAEGHLYRALWQRKHGDNAGALTTLQKGFKTASMPVEAYLLRGMIEQELGMNDAAQRSYAAATELDPSNTKAKAMLDLLNTQSGVASFPADE